jgi:hypothetical protein
LGRWPCFIFILQDGSNSHFLELEFSKASKTARGVDPALAMRLLQPCIYKRR